MTAGRPRHAPWLASALACACLAGCAGGAWRGAASRGAGWAHTPAGEPLSPEAARRAIAVGTSTRADVAAALGPALVVAFDSGYEVWVYRWPGAQPTLRAATELVVLFAPSGPVKKLRVRPGYDPVPAR